MDALEEAATAKVKALEARKLAERIYDRIFLEMAGSIEERKAKARVHMAYQKADDEARQFEHEAIVAKAKADGMNVRFEEFRTNAATARAEMNLR